MESNEKNHQEKRVDNDSILAKIYTLLYAREILREKIKCTSKNEFKDLGYAELLSAFENCIIRETARLEADESQCEATEEEKTNEQPEQNAANGLKKYELWINNKSKAIYDSFSDESLETVKKILDRLHGIRVEEATRMLEFLQDVIKKSATVSVLLNQQPPQEPQEALSAEQSREECKNAQN